MQEPISRLGIGPMSKEIIKAVYSYSHKRDVPLMLIASKNQIDFDSGYVLTTSQFAKYCNDLKEEFNKSNVFLCRDHCGPGFNDISDLSDVYRTIREDIKNGFSLIHIDFSKYSNVKSEILEESKKVIEEIFRINSNIKVEVGTDENDGKNFPSMSEVEEEVAFFTDFCSPAYYTCQTGSLVREINQIGKFESAYVEELYGVLLKYGINLKEHNADYLSVHEIRERKGKVAAQNIAPQLGVLQTQMTITKAMEYGIDSSDFLQLSYESNKWRKWLEKNDSRNKYLCSLIAGHYNFNSVEYAKILDEINKHEDFFPTLEKGIHNLIGNYINNLN